MIAAFHYIASMCLIDRLASGIAVGHLELLINRSANNLAVFYHFSLINRFANGVVLHHIVAFHDRSAYRVLLRYHVCFIHRLADRIVLLNIASGVTRTIDSAWH